MAKLILPRFLGENASSSLQKTKSACQISRLLSGIRGAKLRPACSTLRKVILANESISLRHLSAFLKDIDNDIRLRYVSAISPRSKAHEGLKYCRRTFTRLSLPLSLPPPPPDPAQRERNTKWWRDGFSFRRYVAVSRTFAVASGRRATRRPESHPHFGRRADVNKHGNHLKTWLLSATPIGLSSSVWRQA